MRGADFAFGAAFAKTTRHKDGVIAFEMRRGVLIIENLRIDPIDIDLHTVGHAAMGQRLLDRLVGVFKLHIFADDGDIDLAVGLVDAVGNVLPHRQIGLGRGRDAKRIKDRLVQPFVVIGQRRLIDRFEVIGRDDILFAHIAKQADFLALFFGDRMFGAADQHVRLQADGAQFLDRVLRRFGFQLSRSGQIGQQRQMHENALPARFVMGELADRFKEGQAFDIAHRAANLAEHEIHLILADRDEVFDFIGHMRDDLNGFAKVIAAAFLFQNVGIDPPRGDRIRHPRRNAGEPLVVTKVEIGLGAVIGDENLAMFKGRHRARIDVQIGVELAQAHRKPARLQKRAKRGRGKTLAQGGDNAARDKDEPCHRLAFPRVSRAFSVKTDRPSLAGNAADNEQKSEP